MKKLELSSTEQRLFEWVKVAHSGQLRKYTGEPYWNHLYNVASLVREHAPETKFGVVIALCHDLIEDTFVTKFNLLVYLKFIGYRNWEIDFIVNSVVDISDHYTKENYPELNRKQRKILEAERLVQASKSAQTVKYADIIDNLPSIAQHDPDFARVYISEKEMYIYRMSFGDKVLYNMALSVINETKTALGI